MSLKRNHGQPIDFESANIGDEQIKRFKELFPEVFTEDEKIDWEKLKLTLGGAVDDSPERYSFDWTGKKDSIRLLQTPSKATLIPLKDASVNFENTDNLFIEGDNLEVLKLLYKHYFGLIKMIYIDPPYNTGNDFIYFDNYKDPLDHYLKLSGQRDALCALPTFRGRLCFAFICQPATVGCPPPSAFTGSTRRSAGADRWEEKW